MTEKPCDIGLMGEIGRNFVFLIILVGLFAGVIIQQVARRIFREENNHRVSLMTMNLSDAATAHVISKDVLQLSTLVTKYARLDGIAYAFIKDREERTIAHSLPTFPPELQEELTSDQRRQLSRRTVTLGGKIVHETRAAILEGRLGTVHLGIWADAVEQKVDQIIFMLLWPVALVVLAAAIIAIFLARRLVRPFRRLTHVAGRISSGDLDTPVRVESRHEFGELTRSLERMRASLKAAMVRLGGIDYKA